MGAPASQRQDSTVMLLPTPQPKKETDLMKPDCKRSTPISVRNNGVSERSPGALSGI